jgi:Fur family transcriptional regulator, peroxide stress response regulator
LEVPGLRGGQEDVQALGRSRVCRSRGTVDTVRFCQFQRPSQIRLDTRRVLVSLGTIPNKRTRLLLKSDQKYRMTHQRQVILEEVVKDPGHPTADEIYERVRKKLPRISMGTVYRNLDILVSSGFISRIQPGLPQMRFDGKTREHYHVTCLRCGKIENAPIEPFGDTLNTLELALGRLTKFGIFGHKLEFMGLCKECMEKERRLPINERTIQNGGIDGIEEKV